MRLLNVQMVRIIKVKPFNLNWFSRRIVYPKTTKIIKSSLQCNSVALKPNSLTVSNYQ